MFKVNDKGKQVKNGKQVKFRNPFYDHPLMKKGGVHEKPEKTKRHAMKQKLRLDVNLKKSEWYEQSV